MIEINLLPKNYRKKFLREPNWPRAMLNKVIFVSVAFGVVMNDYAQAGMIVSRDKTQQIRFIEAGETLQVKYCVREMGQLESPLYCKDLAKYAFKDLEYYFTGKAPKKAGRGGVVMMVLGVASANAALFAMGWDSYSSPEAKVDTDMIPTRVAQTAAGEKAEINSPNWIKSGVTYTDDFNGVLTKITQTFEEINRFLGQQVI